MRTRGQQQGGAVLGNGELIGAVNAREPVSHAFMSRISKLPRARAALLVPFAAVLIFAGSYSARGPEKPPPAPKPADCDRAALRVVVDVGHTTEKPGADSARGATEYSFNLRLADEVR